MLRWRETCRWIYNTALAQRKEAWEQERRSVSRVEQQVWLKEAKKADDRLREIHSQAAQDGKLKLSKIGLVKIRLHREIPGTIKTAIIKRDAVGKWWAICAVEIEIVRQQAHKGLAVGLDAGLEKFAALSDGSIIENPRQSVPNSEGLGRGSSRIPEKGVPT